jgi:hypothetical protein
MTHHILYIILDGYEISRTLMSGAMQCGEIMPAMIGLLQPLHSAPLDAYCLDTGVTIVDGSVRPQVRPW